MAEQFLTPREVAEALGLHVRTVRRYIRDGRLEAVRMGNRYRVSRTDLESFIGAPADPDPVVDPGMEADVSCVVDLHPIGPEDAQRLTTLLTSAVQQRPTGPDARLRLDVSEDADRKRVKVVVSGSLTHVSTVLALVATFREQ